MDLADFNDDDFEELLPAAKAAAPAYAIAFRTIALRGGVERVSLSFSADAIAKLEGYPRFDVAWSAKALAFRVRANPTGRFEAKRVPRSDRFMLRAELPSQLRFVTKATEPAPHVFVEDGKTVIIMAPPLFHAPQRLALPAPPAAPGMIGKPVPPMSAERLRHQAAVDAAKAAVPASSNRDRLLTP